MLQLRPEQMERFRAVAVKRFEEWMVVHIGKFFPSRCRQLGENRLRETIRYGIGRGESYGLVGKRDICIYIEIMFVLGDDFDKDPRLAWAHKVLTSGLAASPTEKVNVLYRNAMRRRMSEEHGGGQ